MPAHSKEQYYVLPVKVVHAGALALLVSLMLNGMGTALYSVLRQAGSSPYLFSDHTPARLPINPRKVALEVVDSERYGMHDDNDWASVTPLGHGFVKIGEGEDFYAISMYHQLHCLNGFRKMLSGEQRNASRIEHDEQHVLHCLSYLRQMVLCNADITLEPAFSAENTDGRKTKAAYGTGVTHQCKDWEEIRAFSESNYETWKSEAKGFAASEISVVHSD
ncbi:hypothetical protein M413DRAFT_449795 [Hebeloma cylindrosporum]|uniref:Uncharacterized protein n=1 Tax=Hebeloma cylindrosporum TaxID=76867 RepID=A0A0C3BVI0_HEBCY|nr:hypothetical protein M413DRAFT_449795 [Hebeloma cylindrosporum h7]